MRVIPLSDSRLEEAGRGKKRAERKLGEWREGWALEVSWGVVVPDARGVGDCPGLPLLPFEPVRFGGGGVCDCSLTPLLLFEAPRCVGGFPEP